MRTLKKYYLPVLLSIGIMTSCTKEIIIPMDDIPMEDGYSVLGKKLENPYTLKVMQQAWDNIQSNNLSNGRTSSNKITLTPTHYYVKFKPKNEEELELLLNSDSTVYFYTYPLDYELTEGMKHFQDPEVPKGQPTYRYAAVKIDYQFPAVQYKILEEAFIPEDIPLTNSARNYVTNSDITIALTNEAMRITNNLDYITESQPNNIIAPIDDGGGSGGSGGGSTGCSYCPQGTMQVWDDNLGALVPLVGLEVKARVFLNTKTALTDATGKYIIWHDFSGTPQYSFEWQRYNFTIRDNALDAAETIGPKTDGWWSANFIGGISEFHGTIFRAAHHYYYQNINGLRRPPLNGFWNTQLKIRAYNEANTDINGSHCAACRFLGLGSAIKMYNPQRDTRDIYATVIHELAHASHWSMDQNNYNNGDDIVVESWARGVQWELTRMTYAGYRPPYWRAATNGLPFSNYTGVVEDMRDGLLDYDQVQGYTARQIEDALIGQRTFTNWRINLTNKYNNGTETNLVALFDYWN